MLYLFTCIRRHNLIARFHFIPDAYRQRPAAYGGTEQGISAASERRIDTWLPRKL